MQSPVKIWRNQKKLQSLIGKEGEIISWTTIRVPPGGFGDQAPYPVVVVGLTGGSRITAQLVDLPVGRQVINLTGMKVVTVVRRVTQPDPDGIIPYGVKVKPI